MKPIVFARIADMYYYKGITKKDVPVNGGAYVNETGMAHECYNFSAVEFVDEGEFCLGFSMLQSKKGVDPQFHIEKIIGCEALKTDELVHNVTVVFCSKAPNSSTMRVVGFYKNATVYREYQYQEFPDEYIQAYNFIAAKKDCVLLPYQTRHSDKRWYIPVSTNKSTNFGFGQSNIWYATGYKKDKELYEFLERMHTSIETYDGDNWIDYCVLE